MHRIAMLAATAPLLASGAASAASGALADVLACRAIHEPSARLACYDRATESLGRSAPSSESAPPAASTPTAVPAPAAAPAPPPRPLDPKKTFGLPERVVAEKEVAAGTRAREVRDIRARLVGLSHTADGRTVFQLDNGQTWRELQPAGELLAKVGDAVVISRGWLGSYWLKLPSGRNCKVDRIE